MPDQLFSLIAFAVIATITPGGATILAAASGAQVGFARSIPLIGGIAIGAPIRKPEPMMQGFRSWSGLRRFVATFSALRNDFVRSRLHRSALSTSLHRLTAMAGWKSLTAVA
jgi:hypothetical protein